MENLSLVVLNCIEVVFKSFEVTYKLFVYFLSTTYSVESQIENDMS